jgi:hypothetical protein
MKKCKTREHIGYMKSLKSEICETKLFAKISEYRWYKGQRKIKGKQTGEYTSRAYDLNYCPTCGAKISDIKISK